MKYPKRLLPRFAKVALLNFGLASAEASTRHRARVSLGKLGERDRRACNAASFAEVRGERDGGSSSLEGFKRFEAAPEDSEGPEAIGEPERFLGGVLGLGLVAMYVRYWRQEGEGAEDMVKGRCIRAAARATTATAAAVIRGIGGAMVDAGLLVENTNLSQAPTVGHRIRFITFSL